MKASKGNYAYRGAILFDIIFYTCKYDISAINQLTHVISALLATTLSYIIKKFKIIDLTPMIFILNSVFTVVF
jgi:hypothetical protein